MLHDIQDIFVKGGIFMYPISLGAIWALTLFIERAIYFRQISKRIQGISRNFFKEWRTFGDEAAKQYLVLYPDVLRNVFWNLLDSKELSREKAEKKVNPVLLQSATQISKYLNTLAALGAIIPLMGLLGTVAGMITTFENIALHGSGNAQLLSGGISVALYCTEAGLLAAIPILIGHNLLNNRFQKILVDLKTIVEKALEKQCEVKYAG